MGSYITFTAFLSLFMIFSNNRTCIDLKLFYKQYAMEVLTVSYHLLHRAAIQ